jgi:hypothetical protein
MNSPLVRSARRISLAILLTVLVAPAVGGTLDPNGNPRYGGQEDAKYGSAISDDGKYKVSLGPNPAIFMPQGSCAWLLPALNKQGFTADNGWNITYKTLEGKFTLDTYSAWADKQVTIKLGDAQYPPKGKEAAKGQGGAAFDFTYTPAGKDPVWNKEVATTNIKWIQVIDTNRPNARATKYGTKIADGSTVYLDNARGENVDPYYGHLSNYAFGDGLGFMDEPGRILANFVGGDWEAQVFLSTESTRVVDGKTVHDLTIYDGLWWGFNVTAVQNPEPSTIVLCGSGLVMMIGYRIRRRQKGNGESPPEDPESAVGVVHPPGG